MEKEKELSASDINRFPALPEEKLQEWYQRATKSTFSNYSHFDSKFICLTSAAPNTDKNQPDSESPFSKKMKMFEWVMHPENIASHSFLPFIHFVMTFNKVSKVSDEEAQELDAAELIGKNLRRRVKARDLCYPSHFDSCIYQYYSFQLNHFYTEWALAHNINDVAIAYRPNTGKSNIDYAKQAIDKIKASQQCFILVSDFTGFFDEIDCNYLNQCLCDVLGVDRLPDDWFAVFKSIANYSWVDMDDFITILNDAHRLIQIRQQERTEKKAQKRLAAKAKVSGQAAGEADSKAEVAEQDVTQPKEIEAESIAAEQEAKDTVRALNTEHASDGTDSKAEVEGQASAQTLDVESTVEEAEDDKKTATTAIASSTAGQPKVRSPFTISFINRNDYLPNIKAFKKVSKFYNKHRLDGVEPVYIRNKATEKLKKGIPQGVQICSVMANVYMIHFDEIMQELAQTLGGLYMRYSDDIIFIAPTKSEAACQSIYQQISERFSQFDHLVLFNKDKTRSLFVQEDGIYAFDAEQNAVDFSSREQLSYLGFIFDGQEVLLRQCSISKYHYRLRRKCRTFVVQSLNNKHRDPVNLYRHYSNSVSKKSSNKRKRSINFITYLSRVNKVFNIRDPHVMPLLHRSKQRVRKTIKKISRDYQNRFFKFI